MSGDSHNPTHSSLSAEPAAEESVLTMVVAPTGSVGTDEVHTILPSASALVHTAADPFPAIGFAESADPVAVPDDTAALPGFGTVSSEPVTVLFAAAASTLPPIAETSGLVRTAEMTLAHLSSGPHTGPASNTSITDTPNASETVVQYDSSKPVE